jgi:hypothetical protein
MRTVSTIEPRWLVELTPAFYRKAAPSQLMTRKLYQRLTPRATSDADVGPRDWRVTNQRIICMYIFFWSRRTREQRIWMKSFLILELGELGEGRFGEI